MSPSAISARPIAPPASQIPAPTIAMIPRFRSMDTSPRIAKIDKQRVELRGIVDRDRDRNFGCRDNID